MVTRIRVEAEAETLEQIVKDLDAITALLHSRGRAKAVQPDVLNVHDEHYERVADKLFKARRVYALGQKSVSSAAVSAANPMNITWTQATAS